MKKILFILSLFISASAFAQSAAVNNQNQSTVCSTQGTGCQMSTNNKGNLYVTSGTGTTDLGKQEDSPVVDGETGITSLFIANEALVNTVTLDGDHTIPSVTRQGVQLMTMDSRTQLSANTGILKLEDAASADGNAIVGIGLVREDALTANTSASGDWTWGKTDSSGRLIITNAPVGETWQSCGTATAVTSDVAIKAAVASNRIYVTNITCKNTSATVGTPLDFKDATTVIAVGGVSAVLATGATDGSFFASFPIPLRGSVNTALNFATNTAATSVTCCGSGYISTQ